MLAASDNLVAPAASASLSSQLPPLFLFLFWSPRWPQVHNEDDFGLLILQPPSSAGMGHHT